MAEDLAAPHPWGDITVRYVSRIIKDLQREGGFIALEPLWPIIIGLMERNCLPGKELHPAVRTLYAHFLAVVADAPGHADDARFAAWLAGDITPDPGTQAGFTARFERSRRDSDGNAE